MATHLTLFGILLITSYATASSIQTRNTCPRPRCGPDVAYADCPRVEQGYFIGGDQNCHGCPVCVRDGGYVDSNGCPMMACPIYGHIQGCASPYFHSHFYNYNGETCEDCQVYSCTEDQK